MSFEKIKNRKKRVKMTRLEQAQGKLKRLKRESEEMHHLIRAEHDRIPFGQPNIIGRGDIYKKVNGYHDRAIKLLKEQEKQEKEWKCWKR